MRQLCEHLDTEAGRLNVGEIKRAHTLEVDQTGQAGSGEAARVDGERL